MKPSPRLPFHQLSAGAQFNGDGFRRVLRDVERLFALRGSDLFGRNRAAVIRDMNADRVDGYHAHPYANYSTEEDGAVLMPLTAAGHLYLPGNIVNVGTVNARNMTEDAAYFDETLTYYVSRGELATHDFTTSSGLTADGTWHDDLDLSGIIPEEAAGKLVKIQAYYSGTASALNWAAFREVGCTGAPVTRRQCVLLTGVSNRLETDLYCNASRLIGYQIVAGVTVNLSVLGWWRVR